MQFPAENDPSLGFAPLIALATAAAPLASSFISTGKKKARPAPVVVKPRPAPVKPWTTGHVALAFGGGVVVGGGLVAIFRALRRRR